MDQSYKYTLGLPEKQKTQPKSCEKPIDPISNHKVLISNASPLPWKAVVGRLGGAGARIDILDANGTMICHFHPTIPKNEQTPNWENDAALIVRATEIIQSLLKERV